MSDQGDRPDYLEDPPEIEWPEGGAGVPQRPSEGETAETDAAESESRVVGMASNGMPVVYDSASESLFEGELTEEGRVSPDAESERRLEEDETLADAIRSFGDRVGWESLSEFGREHYEGEDRRR